MDCKRSDAMMRTQAAFASSLVPVLAAAGLVAACGNNTGGSSAPLTTPLKTVAELQDPQTCSHCHQDHFAEWASSMHAYASTDPVFRAMNARGQKETNGALGDFCVKCHAPMAVALGKTTDGLNLDMVDKSLQGITCYFCHNTTDVNTANGNDHNNPLVLANDAIMRGPIKSPIEFGHKGEYSQLFDDDVTTAAFRSSDLCGSCHDIVVPAHFSGAAQDVPLEQTFQEWKSSVFAVAPTPGTPSNPLNCTSGCHMNRLDRVPIANPDIPHPTMPTRTYRHQHDFPAVDIALTEFPQTNAPLDTQLQSIKDKFSTTFRIQICADRPNTTLPAGIYVMVENLAAGHYLPSGASQDRRVWVEVHAYKQGAEIFKSGVVPDGVAATTVQGTWLLYDQAFKADGVTPAHMFWDVAKLSPNVIKVSTVQNANGNQLPTAKPFSANQPERVTVTIWVEPIGLDVIDDMIGSGNYLDPSIRGKIQRFAVQLPTTQPMPTPDGRPVTFDWNVDDAVASLNDPSTSSVLPNGQPCLEFPPIVNINVTPPPP
jgi:hypothetical protein